MTSAATPNYNTERCRWPARLAALLTLVVMVLMGSRRTDAQADLSVYSARADCIVAHESGWDATAVNPRSGAAGLGQFLATTWATTPYAARSRFDPWASHAAVCWMLANGRAREFDVVRRGYC